MKTILIVIDSLGKGGAEVLLVESLQDLSKRYRIILVTLNSKCHFTSNEIACFKSYSLNTKTKTDLLFAVRKLRRIIRHYQVDLIHSHLFYSTLVSRMAKPSRIPLIYSIHSQYSKSLGKLEIQLEKATLRREHVALAVSSSVAMDYKRVVRNKTNLSVLPNFVSDKFFCADKRKKRNEKLKLLAVGNVKEAKNYTYLLEAFKLLKNMPVSIDVYGNTSHPDFFKLKQEVDRNALSVHFRGPCSNTEDLYVDYDALVSCSTNEGFGLSVIEAMACGLPVFLSDIPVFREITHNAATFFDLNSPESFKEIIMNILNEKVVLTEFSAKSKSIAEIYRKENYLTEINKIYAECIYQAAQFQNLHSERFLTAI